MRSLDDRQLRSNPMLDAAAVQDLPPHLRTSVEAIAGGNFWAALRRRDTGQYDMGIDHDTAVIFHALAEPQVTAGLLTHLPKQRRNRAIARLVCDQILQIEQSDGSFVDGVRAHDDLFGEDSATELRQPSLQIDRLSKAALDHALAVRSASSFALAFRLYSFNATPRTRRWDALLGDAARWLGIAPRAPWLERLSQRYDEHGSTKGETPWLQWGRKGVDPRASTRYKIYVSPVSAQLAKVLPVVAEVCSAMDVPAFKVGATLLGVLRSDKLIVYLKDEPALWHVAAELRTALAGFEAQGVPFTAPIDSSGLLSWGIDPKEAPMLKPSDQIASWRTTIAGRLGFTLARAKDCASAATVLDFALERLRLDGIEPIGWRPAEGGEAA